MSLKRALLILYLGFWGGSIGVLGKWSFESFSPVQLIFIRVFVTLLILGTILVVKGRFTDSLQKIVANLRHFTALAFWGVGAAMVLGFVGLGATSAIAYDLLFNLSGVLMVAVSWYGYREKVGGRELGLLSLALVGTALIIIRPSSDGVHSIFGDVLVLLASLGWAIYSVVGGKAVKKQPELDPLTNLFGSFMLASIPLSIYIDQVEPFERAQMTTGAIASALILAIFGTALLFLLWFRFVETSSGATSAMVALSENIGGVIFPMIFLGEALTLRAGFGGAIIISALVLMEYRPARELRGGSK